MKTTIASPSRAVFYTVACMFILPVLWVNSAWPSSESNENTKLISASYNEYFIKYSKRYFGPYFDWRWFRAQAIAESGLDPGASSHRGALGLMQILPSTFDEIRYARPHFDDIEKPRWNIAAGIFYDRLLYEKWQGFAEAQQLLFTFASYNAGYSRVYQAVKRLPPHQRRWRHVAPKLPGETRAYVNRIRNIMQEESADLRGVSQHRPRL